MMMSGEAFADRPTTLDVAALPTLAAYGYDGGRVAFRQFCKRAFEPGAPRFLRSESGALAVFRHADLRSMAAKPDLASLAPNQLFPGVLTAELPDEKPVGYAIADLIKNQLFSANGMLNATLRRVLLDQIGPKPTAARGDATREIALKVLDSLPLGVDIDLVEQIAEPLIGLYWGALIGMTDEEALSAAVQARKMTPMLFLQMEWEGICEADAAAKAYRNFLETASQRSLSAGGCPFVSNIARDLAAIDYADDLDYGGFVPKSAGAFLAGNLFDGFHTAALAITNTIRTLLDHPEVMTQLRAEPEKAATAVAECLRLEAPVIHLNRIVSADLEYDGMIIPAGTRVQMMWAAANRDPAAFPDPERFDLARPQQGATTFGGGAHICPGRFVASLVAKSLVEALIERRITIRAAGDIDDWIGNHAMSQLRHLPVILEK
ncbi:cytochrome P450 [Caulobacter sp. 1776]|uniref:cytochrome P450 n=1 Tax=Caulobacter sp. 1776 TaxID=3156420 RepID=UPI00339612B1